MAYNTGNPLGSTDPRDLRDNSENIDVMLNSTTETSHPDRIGTSRKTWHGMEVDHVAQLAAQESEFQDRIAGMAFTRVGTFAAGFTLTDARQVLLYETDGHEYGWTGTFPKVVPPASTPAGTGGIGVGAWVDRSDVTLRSELEDDTGSELVSFKLSGVATSVKDTIYNIIQDSFIHVDWCGAVGDGVADDWQAIVNANNTAFALGIRCVKFGQKTYRSSKCFNIKEQVTWFSDCGFQSGASKAKIQFDDNTCGIIVHRSNTNADDYGYNNIKEVSPSSGGADGTVIRGLSIYRGNGSDTTIDGITHGVRLRARALIDNCYISGFAGNNIHIVAISGGTDETEGNANNWGVSNTRCQNGQDGIFVDGADVNVGMALHLDCSSNARYGIYDSSFLGCNWVGCHCNGNAVDDILHDSNNAPSVFVGQYVESGGSVTFIKPAYIIGGQYAGVTKNGTYYSLESLPNFTTASGAFNGATTGTGRYISTWNQGSVSATRASTYNFYSGLTTSYMPTGSVKARPTASNITNRSAIGFEIYDGTTLLYETALECRGNTNDIVTGSDASWDLGDQSLRFNNAYAVTLYTGSGTAKWTSGAGSPEGILTAVVGSMYTRTDGGAGTTLYIKESGAGNTGWVAK